MNEKKKLTIREVRKLPKDSTFNVLGVVSRLSRKKDRNGNPFWDIVITDGSGELEGKIWSNSGWWDLTGGERYPLDPLAEDCPAFEGATAGMQGKVVEFRDQLQYNFNDIYYVDQEKYPPHGFVRRSPLSDERMEEGFRALINETDEPIRGFLEAVFFKHGLWTKFKTWPAAVSLHHAYVGGLLEHSLSVAGSAKALAQNYIAQGMKVDMNLVIAGGLLHDLGKLDAYALTPIPQMTTAGNVADHIVLGYHRLMSLAAEEGLDSNITLALGHILVSHHGRREYGSPVLPETPEAMIVSAADDLDFKVFYWRSQIEGLDARHDVTDYIPLLERRFWRGISAPAGEAEAGEISTPSEGR
ncbi:MAG: HD domain-containing protein [Synergistaceae bacterium]|nr:HD domain-containing protein [Synergistaceae bacterium]